jgi:mono/diheme cytochrome c family protein
MPKWIAGLILSTTVLALVPFAIIAKARASKSPEPHYHIFSDMDFQSKAKSDTGFDLFPDGRANRGQMQGTVARGQEKAETDYYEGIRKNKDTGLDEWITDLPADILLDVDRDFVNRGRERYNIYCAPCHGFDGQGKGTVPQRVTRLGGTWEARNLVAAGGPAILMPNGQLYNTISNGYNTMSGYAAQIQPRDRWAIVLYVRALQRGQHADLDDDEAFNRSAP